MIDITKLEFPCKVFSLTSGRIYRIPNHTKTLDGGYVAFNVISGARVHLPLITQPETIS